MFEAGEKSGNEGIYQQSSLLPALYITVVIVGQFQLKPTWSIVLSQGVKVRLECVDLSTENVSVRLNLRKLGMEVIAQLQKNPKSTF